MGVVYRARDLKLDRECVLKFLPPFATPDDESKRRQRQEAKAASALDHPNICTIYGLEESDGQAFISMAYYPGEVLTARIARGPLPIEETIRIARQVATGLEAAHARGIIHRDIKPGNIMLTSGGVVKLLDFGLARLAGEDRITQAGATAGTAAYMSPEQLRGHDLDRRTDVWSFGVVLYEMVTGERPFQGARLDTLIHAVLSSDRRPMASLRSGIPESLERVVRKALARDPAGRQADMSQMLQELPLLGEDRGSNAAALAATASLPVPPDRRGRGVRTKAIATVAAVAAVVLLLAGTGGLLWRNGRARNPSTSSRSTPPSGSEARGAAAPVALKRVAVMPFANRRHDPATDYLAYALADRITDRLGYVQGILVRPSSATRDLGGAGFDPASAGSKLRVDYVVTGGFASDPHGVHLDVELVNIASGARIPQEKVTVGSGEMFRLQDLVADQVARGLRLELNARGGAAVKTDVPRNPLAYEQYLQALSYPHGYAGDALAFPLLQKSLALDPEYAPAWAELGNRAALASIYSLGGASKAKEAERAFEKALALNGRLLSALSGLAKVYNEGGESEKAIGLLREALQINPNHADSHFALSYIYRYAGMLAREGELALSLDANNPRYRSVATTYLYLGDLDRSLEVHKLDPDSGWTLARIGQIYLRRGEKDLALASLTRAIEKEPASSSGRWAVAMRAALLGRREEGLAALRRSNEPAMVDGEQRYHFANIHCLLGDREGCLTGLRAAVKGGFFNYPFLMTDSLLDPVRSDRRFPSILAEAKEKHDAFQARFFPGAADRR